MNRTTPRQGSAPAHSEHTPASPAAFTWYASRHNMSFARLAACESAERYALDNDVCGLGTSPMYQTLAAGFRKAYDAARPDDREYICEVFAARCYRAGHMAGEHE